MVNFDNEREDSLIGVKMIEKLMDVQPHGIAGERTIMGCRLVCEVGGAIKNRVSGHEFHMYTRTRRLMYVLACLCLCLCLYDF